MSANFTHHYLFRNKFLNSAVTGFFLTIRWTLRQVIQDPHSHPARFTAAVPPNRQAPTRHCIRRSKFTHIRKAERIHGTFQKNALIKHAVFHASGRWVGLSQVCGLSVRGRHPFSLPVQRQSAPRARLACVYPSARPALTTTAGSDLGLASELMSDM